MNRIQRKRTKGWRMPDNTRYVGRGTRWGNPWSVVERSNGMYGLEHPRYFYNREFESKRAAIEKAVDFYRLDVDDMLAADPRWLDELRGYDALACWCPLNQPCHADVLIELLEARR